MNLFNRFNNSFTEQKIIFSNKDRVPERAHPASFVLLFLHTPAHVAGMQRMPSSKQGLVAERPAPARQLVTFSTPALRVERLATAAVAAAATAATAVKPEAVATKAVARLGAPSRSTHGPSKSPRTAHSATSNPAEPAGSVGWNELRRRSLAWTSSKTACRRTRRMRTTLSDSSLPDESKACRRSAPRSPRRR